MYGDFYEYVSIGYDRGLSNSGNQNFNVVRINNGVELLGQIIMDYIHF